jgi:hypothetical protein
MNTSAVVLAAALIAYKLLGRLIDEWAFKHFTVVSDLKLLAVERYNGRKVKGTAVICGGR